MQGDKLLLFGNNLHVIYHHLVLVLRIFGISSVIEMSSETRGSRKSGSPSGVLP